MKTRLLEHPGARLQAARYHDLFSFYDIEAERAIMSKALLFFLVAIFPSALSFVVPTTSGGAFTHAIAKVGCHSYKVARDSAERVTAWQPPTMSMERSYIMIKPDGVQRG